MKQIILTLFLLFSSSLYGCATCQLMTPTAEVKLNVQVEHHKLVKVHTQWLFSSVYTDEMYTQYDKNKNSVLDKTELGIILKAMLDYLIPKEMISEIQYAYDEDNYSSKLKFSYDNFDLKVVNGHLLFLYDGYSDLEIKNNLMLSFSFEDDESFFEFLTSSLEVSGENNFSSSEHNLYLFTASVYFKENGVEKKESRVISKEQNQTVPVKITREEIVKTVTLQEDILTKSIEKIKSLFESIKDEKNPLAYIYLLFFAYIYGVVHALGPGHGKTLVGSYFLSNERSYSKAFFVSLAIGLVHTFSAFILTLVVYYIVDTFLAQFLDESIYYTTKISALIIVSIALYLLYIKYKAYKAIEKVSPYSFSVSPHAMSCVCSSCKVDKNSTDAGLIISAGIIPCPGTVTIFIFSLSLGLYYTGFLSALAMSLGMSTVIFISALISVAIRKKTSAHNNNLKKYLEYGSLVLILFLGLFLLFV